MANSLLLVQDDPQSVIIAWLAEHWVNSKRTVQAYADYLAGMYYSTKECAWIVREDARATNWRTFIQAQGCDLFSPARELAPCAQAWATLPNSASGAPVSASTHNLRLTAVSSFYEYAIRHEVYAGPNPIRRVKRRKRQMFSDVRPLAYMNGEVDIAIDAIPSDTLNGLRDRALLSLALYTGRRLSEIADLTCGDIALEANVWIVTWQHTKGDKKRRNELPVTCPAILYLAKWLKSFYGLPFPKDGVVFPSLSRNSYGHRMTAQGLEQICKAWLDTSRFHRLRHTFAAAYMKSGGTLPDLSRLLGHSNVAITTTYVVSMEDGKNEQLDAMQNIFAGRELSGK